MPVGSKVSKALIAKICIPIVAVLAVVGGFFAWNSLHQRTDHFAAIPSDAVMVVKVNAGQLLKKSNIAELEEFKDLIDETRDEIEDGELTELFDKITQDPKSIGFDLAAPMAISVSNIENPQVMFVAAVDDRKILESNIQTILDSNEDDDLVMKVEDDFTTIRDKYKKSTDIAFNEDRFVVVISVSGAARKATRYLEQKKDESLFTKENISDFMKSGDDVSLFVDCDPIFEYAKRSNLNGLVDVDFDFKAFKGASSYTALNFENGKVVLHSKNYPTDKMKSMTDGAIQKPAGTYLDEMPEDTYAALQFGVGDFKPIVKYMMSAVPSRELRSLNQGLEEIFGSGTTLTKVAGYFTGDFAMYAAGDIDDLTWGVNISCNKKVTNVLNNLMEDQCSRDYSTWERDGKDFVSVSWYDREPQYYVRTTNDGIRVSSKKNRPKKSLRDSENAKYLKNNGGFIDFERILKLPIVKDELKKEAGVYELCKLFKILYFTFSESGYEGDMVLELSDKNDNSLHQIVVASIEFFNAQKKRGSLLNNEYDYEADNYDDYVDIDTVSDYYYDEYVEDSAW